MIGRRAMREAGGTTDPVRGRIDGWDISEDTVRKSMMHYEQLGKAIVAAQRTRKRVARQNMLRHTESGDVPCMHTTWKEVKAQRAKRPWFCVLEGGRPWKVVFEQARCIAMLHASWCVGRSIVFPFLATRLRCRHG